MDVTVVVRTKGGAEYRAERYSVEGVSTVTMWGPEVFSSKGWTAAAREGRENWAMSIPWENIDYIWEYDVG